MPSMFTLTKPPSETIDRNGGRSWLARIFSLDIVVCLYVFATVMVVPFGHEPVPNAGRIVWLYIGGLAVYLLARWGSAHGPVLRSFFYTYLFAMVIALYEGMGTILLHVRADAIESRMPDAWLASLDLRLFGSDPTTWFTPLLNPATVTFLQLCYASYFFLTVVTILVILTKRKHASVLSYAAVLIGCFFTTYIGYYLVPAYGPRIFYEYATPIPHSALSQAIYGAIDHVDLVMLNAFPSGHTAVSLCMLAILFYEARRIAWLFVPLVAGLIIATVALRYHYLIDVVAGVIVAAVWVPWGMRLVFWFDYHPRRRADHAVKPTK